MLGGYRAPFDPRPLFAKLETDQDTAPIWKELWDGLHHQGDVGEASYAAVPHLVRIHRTRGKPEWNPYAMVAIIELARTECTNPELPDWVEEDYFRSIRELAEIGATEFFQADEPDTILAILSILAISKGLRTHGNYLVNYSEEELLGIESRM